MAILSSTAHALINYAAKVYTTNFCVSFIHATEALHSDASFTHATLAFGDVVVSPSIIILYLRLWGFLPIMTSSTLGFLSCWFRFFLFITACFFFVAAYFFFVAACFFFMAACYLSIAAYFLSIAACCFIAHATFVFLKSSQLTTFAFPTTINLVDLRTLLSLF